MSKVKTLKRHKSKLKRIINIAAIGSLLLAYVWGFINRQGEVTQQVEGSFSGKKIEKINSTPMVFQISDSTNNLETSWLIINEQQGWGGPMSIGTHINFQGKVENIITISHTETPSFYSTLVNNGFFHQFIQKNLQDVFQLENDVEAVSGATVSSRAITRAVREGAHWWGREHFAFIIEEIPMKLNFGSNEFILIVLYAVVIVSAVRKYKKMRLVTLAFSAVFLGFYLNVPLSISTFGSLLLGYVPSLYEYLFWWLLVAGAILMALVMGKNLYCTWACPFGGMQEIIMMIGGIKITINRNVSKIAEKLVYVLFWLSFMIMFLTSNPAIGTFEPFAVLFSLKGLGVQWYLVTVAIVGSFIIPRFWCRFFCPVGYVLKTVSKVKKQISLKFKSKQIEYLGGKKAA